MTKEERKIRFEVALEMANKVYSDYCKDLEVTREQKNKFCDLIQEMI